MKKSVLFAAGLLLMGTASSFAQSAVKTTAQYVSMGPVIGVGHNWVGNMGGTSRLRLSDNLGIGVVYARDEHWGYGGQLGFSSEGYDVDYPGYNATAIATYLRVPLQAYYFFGDYKNTVRPKIFAGPEVAVKLYQQDVMNNRYSDAGAMPTGDFRAMDAGINVGGGVNIQLAKSTWFNFDLGYYQGLVDVINDPADKYNVNHNLGAKAGILFGIK